METAHWSKPRTNIESSVKLSHFLHFITNFLHYLYSEHYSSHFTVESTDCLHYDNTDDRSNGIPRRI